MVYTPQREMIQSKAFAHELAKRIIEEEEENSKEIPQIWIEDTIAQLQKESNYHRAGITLTRFNARAGILEYLNAGDNQLVHFRPRRTKKKKQGKSIKEKRKLKQSQVVDLSGFEVNEDLIDPSQDNYSKDAKEKESLGDLHEFETKLTILDILDRHYFNAIQPLCIGKNGMNLTKEASYRYVKINPGDLVMLMNRGVADALFVDEINTLIERFYNTPDFDMKNTMNLEILADIICERAVKKIEDFEMDRPLVKKIKMLRVSPTLVSVDEAICSLEFYHQESEEGKK